MSSAHGSTVDRPFKTKGYAIRAVRARSKGPARTRAGCSGDVAGDRGGAAVPRGEFTGAPYPAA
jgi:hypothetical protein